MSTNQCVALSGCALLAANQLEASESADQPASRASLLTRIGPLPALVQCAALGAPNQRRSGARLAVSHSFSPLAVVRRPVSVAPWILERSLESGSVEWPLPFQRVTRSPRSPRSAQSDQPRDAVAPFAASAAVSHSALTFLEKHSPPEQPSLDPADDAVSLPAVAR